MDPAGLPRLTITSISDGLCSAKYEQSRLIGEEWIGCLYLGEGHFVWGRFYKIESANQTCLFRPKNDAEISQLQSGGSYPYLDGYWGERAELVLDLKRQWHKARFEPRDATQFPSINTTILKKSSEEPSLDARVIKGGWDHEHCAICWEKILPSAQAEGFISQPDIWVCERCYTQYVEPKSLDFIV
jgi:hypothetical protein